MSIEDRVALLEETVKKQSALIDSQSSFIKRLASEHRRTIQLHTTTLDSHSRLLSFFSRSLFPGGHWIEGVGKAWEWSLVSPLPSSHCSTLASFSTPISTKLTLLRPPFYLCPSSFVPNRRSTYPLSYRTGTDLLPLSSACQSSFFTRSSRTWTFPPSSPSASPPSVSSPSLPSSSIERSPSLLRRQIVSSAFE